MPFFLERLSIFIANDPVHSCARECCQRRLEHLGGHVMLNRYPCESVAGLLLVLLIASRVVAMYHGVSMPVSDWIVVPLVLAVQRFVASGYTSPNPVPVVDMAMCGSQVASLKCRSLALRVRSYRFATLEVTQPLKGRIHLVTGGTMGSIGYWTAVQLARLGATVVMTCRTLSMARASARHANEEAAVSFPPEVKLGKILAASLELTDGDSITKLDTQLRALGIKALHCVVHNAGIMNHGLTTTTPADKPELTVRCNFVATQALADHLAPWLEKTASDEGTTTRHVFVSSIAHRFLKTPGADLDGRGKHVLGMLRRCMVQMGSPARGRSSEVSSARPPPSECYFVSKMGNIFSAHEMQITRGDVGVQAVALHPGCAITDITRDLPLPLRKAAQWLGGPLLGWVFKSPLEAAYTSVQCCLDAAASDDLETRKRPALYWQDCAPAQATDVASCPHIAAEAVALARDEVRMHMGMFA
jgi:NAD(P)-dependent dehydrogenase (short-subunit alcohol dehydrogenase family)